MDKERFTRQLDIVNCLKLAKSSVTIVGTGSVGSFTTLLLGKMGVGELVFFDEDGISKVNLPVSFFKNSDIDQYKVDALSSLLSDFTDCKKIIGYNVEYTNQKLCSTVIVVTDNITSRRKVWEQFLKQKQCKTFIDARMGAEISVLYLIRSKSADNRAFYEETLHKPEDSAAVKCTAKTIIYNVAGIASDICRAYKAMINNESHPREIIRNGYHISQQSWMTRE